MDLTLDFLDNKVDSSDCDNVTKDHSRDLSSDHNGQLKKKSIELALEDLISASKKSLEQQVRALLHTFCSLICFL